MGSAICAPASEPSDDIMAGRFTTAYSNAMIFVLTKTGDALQGIVIFSPPTAENGEPQKEIRAQRGTIAYQSATQINLVLNDVQVRVARIVKNEGERDLSIISDEKVSSLNFTLYRKSSRQQSVPGYPPQGEEP